MKYVLRGNYLRRCDPKIKIFIIFGVLLPLMISCQPFPLTHGDLNVSMAMNLLISGEGLGIGKTPTPLLVNFSTNKGFIHECLP